MKTINLHINVVDAVATVDKALRPLSEQFPWLCLHVDIYNGDSNELIARFDNRVAKGSMWQFPEDEQLEVRS